MFDIDSGKLLIIGIVALVVIGPKELPGVLRQVGLALGKVRRMAAEFQGQFMEAMRESELEELKKDVQKMSDSANFSNFDPLADVKSQLEEVSAQVETSLAAPVAPVEAANLPAPEAPPSAESAPLAEAPEADHAPIKTSGAA
jgi:sec-independent protein translocase protein TatB